MTLNETLQFPVKNRDNLIRLFIGGLLNLVPIVNLIPSGYAFLLMRRQILEDPARELNEWENWGTLFKYGLLCFLIGLGYAIIPLILYGIGLALFIPQLGILKFLGITFICVGGVFTLAAMIFFPMGVLLFAIEDELTAAFNFFRVIEEVKNHLSSYFKVFLIIFIMGLISGLISLIPLFGWIVGILAGFYISLETALFMAEVGWEITGREAPISSESAPIPDPATSTTPPTPPTPSTTSKPSTPPEAPPAPKPTPESTPTEPFLKKPTT